MNRNDHPLYLAWLGLRTLVFYIGYVALTTWFSLSAVVFLYFAPYRWRYRYLIRWNHAVVWWLRLACGVRFKVEGREHIPKHQPLVVLCKHQSGWETFFMNTLFPRLATIMKKELLDIPVFGWGLSMVNPIAIDRSTPKTALRMIMDQGRQRLAEGLSVLIFPEGTRMAYGTQGNYARGGASLAIDAKVPVIFVAHNAGRHWPAHRFLKYPGLITVAISPPVATEGRSSRELTEEAEQWIEGAITRFE